MATSCYSSKEEGIVAAYLDGYLTPNSGATPFKKGDVVLDDTVLECKTKTKESATHAIKLQWIQDLKRESLAMGKKYWALIFDYGTQDIKDQYVVIPIEDFREYMELKRKENE